MKTSFRNTKGQFAPSSDHLGLDSKSASIAPPALTKLANAITEEWTKRFRAKRQDGWTNRGW